MLFMGEFVGDRTDSKKNDSKKVKYGIEASWWLLSKYAWFNFFRHSGAKISSKHQVSLLGVLEGWGKSESWVIL